VLDEKLKNQKAKKNMSLGLGPERTQTHAEVPTTIAKLLSKSKIIM
jgi:hypothetical protein